MKIIISEEAWRNLFQILDYLDENWSNKVSNDFEEKVFQTINNLYDFPEMYILINKRKRIRRAMIFPYLGMYFRVDKNKIEIITFFDQRQDPKKLKLK